MSDLSWVGLLLAASVVSAAERPPAPHAECVDARTVLEARHLDERAVLLKTAEAGYRVELAETCPPSDSGDLVAMAPHGWICGAKEEYVRAGGRVCAIARVVAVNDRDWAVALRDHAKTGGPTNLGTVTVEAKVATTRRFAASTEYCVDPRRVRGWNVSGRDLLVNTTPRRGSREAQSYRLELGRSCPEADIGSGLQLQSGVGIGWICGHPGDRALISGPAAPAQGGIIESSAFGTSAALSGCPIVAVYPVR